MKWTIPFNLVLGVLNLSLAGVRLYDKDYGVWFWAALGVGIWCMVDVVKELQR